jgi:hypothetical protein
VHPDSGRLRRNLASLDELWRRSGGTLPALAPEALVARVRAQLDSVTSWDDFQHTRVGIDPAELIDQATRERLEALPGMARIRGDAVPIDYEVAAGEGVARIRLREGQARRLRADEVPPLDRPVRFAVQRGRHGPLLADSLSQLHTLLRRAPQVSEQDDDRRGGRGGGRRGRGRGGPRHSGAGRRR